jgi:hypothetical protein
MSHAVRRPAPFADRGKDRPRSTAARRGRTVATAAVDSPPAVAYGSARPTRPPEPRPPEQPADRPPGLLHGLRVLIVDDNATNRHILQDWLRGWQMKPAAVGDGRAALDALCGAARPNPGRTREP